MTNVNQIKGNADPALLQVIQDWIDQQEVEKYERVYDELHEELLIHHSCLQRSETFL